MSNKIIILAIKLIVSIGLILLLGFIEPLLPAYIPDWSIAIAFMSAILVLLRCLWV